MKRRALVAVILAAAIGLLWWMVHRSADVSSTPAARRSVAAPRFTKVGEAPHLGDPALDTRNLPPPPPGFYRGGARTRGPTGAERKLAAGEFPVRPPSFGDPADRAKFRAWWIDEYLRRTRIYVEHAPGEYPNDEETRRLLEALYDQGEPPRQEETAEQFDARQQAWFETWRTLTAAFGTPPTTVIGFGGDPQYGDGARPPVLPPGAAPLEPDDSLPTMSGDGLPPAPTPFGSAGPR
jgi:hypothetical protein